MTHTAPEARRVPARQVVFFGAVAVVVLLCAAYRGRIADNAFWDAHVYAAALQRWQMGVDPYVLSQPYVQGKTFPFVGPPVFLFLMSLVRHVFPGVLGLRPYIVLAVLSTFAIPVILSRYYLPGASLSAPLALVIFSASYGTWALLTGNISNLLYALVLIAGVPGLRRNKWHPFLATVCFAALIKPPFLALLILPVLAGNGQLWGSLCSCLACLAGYVAEWCVANKLTREFQQSVTTQVTIHRDAGFGIYLHLLRPGKPPLPYGLSPSIISAALLAPVLLIVVRLRVRRAGVTASPLWVPCLLTFAILCNPRLQTYDADVAMVPAVYILVEICKTLRVRWQAMIASGLALLMVAAALKQRRELLIFATLVLAVALAIYKLFRYSSDQQYSCEPASSMEAGSG